MYSEYLMTVENMGLGGFMVLSVLCERMSKKAIPPTELLRT